MTQHTVTVAFERDWGAHRPTLTCHAPEQSECHAEWDCQCDTWTNYHVKDGRPIHTAYDGAVDADVSHTGRFDPAHCNLRDWLDNGDGQELAGTMSAPVTAAFNGDGYDFTTAPAVPMPVLPLTPEAAELAVGFLRHQECYQAAKVLEVYAQCANHEDQV